MTRVGVTTLLLWSSLAFTACDSGTDAPLSWRMVTDDSVTVLVDSSRALLGEVRDVSGRLLDVRLTWASLDTGVATVDSAGVVTVRGLGVARIVVAADTVSRIIPVRSALKVVEIARNGGCVRSEDGLVFCFGRRMDLPRDVVSLSMTSSMYCALTSAGAAWCWSRYYPPGDGQASSEIPVAVSGGHDFMAISAGARHACGVRTDGVLLCWGSNDFFALTDQFPPFSDVLTPQPVVTAMRFSAVVASVGGTTCALSASGWFCWGMNWADVTGTPGNPGRCLPEPCVAQPSAVIAESALVSVEIGYGHGCGLTATGQAWCWGTNGNGELGDSSWTGCRFISTSCSSVPQAVNSPVRFQRVSLGDFHTCGLATDGSVWCWGRRITGSGSSTISRDVPLPTALSGSLRFTSLVSEYLGTCGMATDGRAYCWGQGPGDPDRWNPVLWPFSY